MYSDLLQRAEYICAGLIFFDGVQSTGVPQTKLVSSGQVTAVIIKLVLYDQLILSNRIRLGYGGTGVAVFNRIGFARASRCSNRAAEIDHCYRSNFKSVILGTYLSLVLLGVEDVEDIG